MWNPQKFVLKLHIVQAELLRMKTKLRGVQNAQNRQERLHLPRDPKNSM